jgi:iron(III) transport system substrate-binding protein
VQAKDPSISPVTGNFKFTLHTPDVAAADAEPLKTWLAIYDELFK